MVTRVCGSVGRLNPTTVVNDENSHFETLALPQWRTLRPKQYWPQRRVRSVTPHTLNFVRDGIILADLHKSLQIWGWFLPKKIDLPTQGGGRNGNFRGSKNQNSGKCHGLSRKSIKIFFLPIPPRGFRGGWGSKLKKVR